MGFTITARIAFSTQRPSGIGAMLRYTGAAVFAREMKDLIRRHGTYPAAKRLEWKISYAAVILLLIL